MVPVIASNRIGTETIDQSSLSFYGSSFITDNKGGLVAQADRFDEGIIIAELDLGAMRTERSSWGLFRDRRPDRYALLMTSDGVSRSGS
jgi:N-carbamoylputrescine amidase